MQNQDNGGQTIMVGTARLDSCVSRARQHFWMSVPKDGWYGFSSSCIPKAMNRRSRPEMELVSRNIASEISPEVVSTNRIGNEYSTTAKISAFDCHYK
jgi:hypothetical protein